MFLTRVQSSIDKPIWRAKDVVSLYSPTESVSFGEGFSFPVVAVSLYGDHRDLPSFPTRRSSDLGGRRSRSAPSRGRARASRRARRRGCRRATGGRDRKSTRLNSSHTIISYP